MKSTADAPKQRSRVRGFLKSIRFRLTLWTVVILAVILAVFSVFIYTRQSNDLMLDAERQLDVRVQQVLALYRPVNPIDTDSDHSAPPAVNVPQPIGLQDNEMYAVVDLNGNVVQSGGEANTETLNQLVQLWEKTAKFPAPAYFTGTPSSAATSGIQTDTLYTVSPVFIEKRLVAEILVGQPLDPRGQLPRLLVTLLLGSLATLAIALAGGVWLASRAMAPVRTITRTAKGISETDLHRRLNLGTQDELGELADTFDAMLDRLQAAFERQRQFTADASHELRTPLTIVNLEADHALARRRSVEEYERTLKVIQSENEFMTRLVNDLLTLARMDAGQTQLKMEPLDLSDVALDVVERLASLAHRAGVAMTSGDLPEVPVTGDRQALVQMLTNLIENAIKYAGGRGKHVQVETGETQINGKHMGWVHIEDDGPGIPAEHLPHLFDRFYRVDQARSRQADNTGKSDGEKSPDGSGLGLSIVHWVARAHNGEVTVQSEEGHGTIFMVSLPWREAPPEDLSD